MVAPKRRGAPATAEDRASRARQPSSTSDDTAAGDSPEAELSAYTVTPKTPSLPDADCPAQTLEDRIGIPGDETPNAVNLIADLTIPTIRLTEIEEPRRESDNGGQPGATRHAHAMHKMTRGIAPADRYHRAPLTPTRPRMPRHPSCSPRRRRRSPCCRHHRHRRQGRRPSPSWASSSWPPPPLAPSASA